MARGEERNEGRLKENNRGKPEILRIRKRREAYRRSKRERKREITVKRRREIYQQ